MRLQNYEQIGAQIRDRYAGLVQDDPDTLAELLKLSWSNWGFGHESLEASARRLSTNGIEYIELHGNRYGPDIGYDSSEVRSILDGEGVKVSGICGMFSAENDLSSNSGVSRQNAIDYIRRNVDMGHDLGASYFLIVPGAVGRPNAIDDMEFGRSVETLRLVADVFVQSGIRGAVEPIRSAEVSFCHTIDDAFAYIEEVDHPGVRHVNGDAYHMQSEESHIGEAVLKCGDRLANLHMADSNRRALGLGSMDLDTLIMSMYVAGANRNGCFVTPEPLGPGGDPYPAMYGRHDAQMLDELVRQTASYFREREQNVKDTCETELSNRSGRENS